jgi:hypothetical protein
MEAWCIEAGDTAVPLRIDTGFALNGAHSDFFVTRVTNASHGTRLPPRHHGLLR